MEDEGSRAAVHRPVLLPEVLQILDPQPGGVFLDGTLGAGGHSEAILERTAPDGILIGLDRDEEILGLARVRLAKFGNRARLHHAKYSEMERILLREKLQGVNGLLLDLGVSSLQLDQANRGFSFMHSGPLDMRMDRSEECWTAAEIVNRLTERELADVIYQFGDERKSRRIARYIVERRKKRPFSDTLDLATLIEAACGRHEKIHPATRTFQALRIAANQELEELKQGLESGLARLLPGGRMAVISFHSLEDRMVKERFRAAAKTEEFALLVKKPLTASYEEQDENRRSRSAKLRAVERVRR